MIITKRHSTLWWRHRIGGDVETLQALPVKDESALPPEMTFGQGHWGRRIRMRVVECRAAVHFLDRDDGMEREEVDNLRQIQVEFCTEREGVIAVYVPYQHHPLAAFGLPPDGMVRTGVELSFKNRISPVVHIPTVPAFPTWVFVSVVGIAW